MLKKPVFTLTIYYVTFYNSKQKRKQGRSDIFSLSFSLSEAQQSGNCQTKWLNDWTQETAQRYADISLTQLNLSRLTKTKIKPKTARLMGQQAHFGYCFALKQNKERPVRGVRHAVTLSLHLSSGIACPIKMPSIYFVQFYLFLCTFKYKLISIKKNIKKYIEHIWLLKFNMYL